MMPHVNAIDLEPARAVMLFTWSKFSQKTI